MVDDLAKLAYGSALRRLAYDLHRFWTSNDAVVARLARVYWFAGLALAIEVTLLLVSVSDTLV